VNGFDHPDPARLLDLHARAHPDRLLFVAPGEVPYARAAVAVRGIAAGLAALGLKRGDRLVIVAPNRIETVLLALAALRCGVVFVLLHPSVGARGLQGIAEDCRPGLAVFDPSTAHLAPAVAPARVLFLGPVQTLAMDLPLAAAAGDGEAAGEGELAALVYTSGTTGRPRGVMVSRGNLRFTVAAIQSRLRYTGEDVVGLFLPLAFDYGLYQIFLTLAAGASLFVGDPRESGPQLVSALAAHRISVLPGTPRLTSGLVRLLESRPRPLPALRLITNTGDHLPAPIIRSLQRLLPQVRVALMYGLTECKRISILPPEEVEAHPGSVGLPLPGTEAFIVDAEGRRLPPGEVGELRVRGPHVTMGYWRAGAETASCFLPAGEGFGERELATGDLCRMDADGRLSFAGRRDSLLKHHGFRVDPREVEEAVLEMPGVSGAALVKSRRDDHLHLFVVPQPRHEPASLLPHLRERFESFKLPEEVHLIPELPMTPNGKVDRRRLAAWAEGEAG
jgi:amino acid adenylation domain-containing protein